MTRHGSLNSSTTHPALGTPAQDMTMHHCGRCKNPFLSNPNCECHCHGKESKPA